MAFDNVPRVKVWVQKFPDRPHLVLQWHDPDTGRRKSKTAGTADPEGADRLRADLEYELNHGKHLEASRMSWERFRELFEQEYVSGTRYNTRENYRITLDLFEQLCRPSRLRSISERTVSAFVAGLRKLPVQGGRVGNRPSTIKVRLQFLHTTLAWAVQQKLIPAVPKFPTVKVPKKKPQPVPAEAFERLLAVAPDAQTRTYLLCGWLAGLRLSEAALLRWQPAEDAPYLDLARDRIILPAAFAKSDEDQWLPLDPELRQALEALARRGPKVFRFLAPDGHEVTTGALSDRVRRLARKAGLKLTMHTLRKGFGCRYAATESAHVLQRLMRHASIGTTMAYYANIDDAVERAVKCKNHPAGRNTSRNTTGAGEGQSERAGDATLSTDSTPV
jgi:integrase